jgi:hypothetical protein
VSAYDVSLAAGKPAQIVVATAAAGRPDVLQLWATAADPAGNEVLVWASPERPREIPLRWDPPQAWYRRWWVWAVAGTAVAATTGAAVYFGTREPPDDIAVDFRWDRLTGTR